MRIITHDFGRVCYDESGRWVYVRDDSEINCPEPHNSVEAIELDDRMIGK